MSHLETLLLPIDNWLAKRSTSDERRKKKRLIIKSILGITGNGVFSDIAITHDISGQGARTIAADLYAMLERNCPEYDGFKRTVEEVIDEVVPETLVECKIALQKRAILPVIYSDLAFLSLLKKMGLHYKIFDVGRIKVVIAKRVEESALDFNRVTKRIIRHLKIKLLVTPEYLSESIGFNLADIKLIIKASPQLEMMDCGYVVNREYSTAHNDYFGYLFSKIFSVYEKFLPIDLLQVVRRKTRLKCDSYYLQSVNDNSVVEALIKSGLVFEDQGYYYGEGKPSTITDAEKIVIKALKLRGQLTGRNIRKLSENQGWSKPTSVFLVKSPLLRQINKNWYSLYPHQR